jgi:ABC-type antimicrobial peptide transport system permease subunit
MVRALVPTARVRVERMTDRYAATFADEQLASSIMSAFGGVAFVVAAAGVYGVMAFLVAARTREIGIRMALGADRGAVRSLVLKSSMPPVLAGAAVGLIGAAVAMHWAESLYFGVSTATPATFAAVGLLVVLTAMAAAWQPARQAGRVDPSRLLRE